MILPWKLSSAYLANILIFSGIEDVFTKNSPAQDSITKSAFHRKMFAFIHDIYNSSMLCFICTVRICAAQTSRHLTVGSSRRYVLSA